MPRISLILLTSLFIQHITSATHNWAGEITYQQIDAFTIEASIITYTNANSVEADRDTLWLDWGDGTISQVVRVNGVDEDFNGVPDGELLEHDYRKNIYTSTHVYPDFQSYTISMSDPNREHDILNVNNSNSEEIPFYIETLVVLGPEPNDSPILLQAPIDIGYVNQPFEHLPVGFDAEGDSLVYELMAPLMAGNTPVTNYQTLTEIVPGANNNVIFDNNTGLLIWQSPQLAGLYTIAIKIESYRDGQLNGRVIRDMLINVMPDENLINTLTSNPNIDNTILEAAVGFTIQLDIETSDDDENQIIALTSISGFYDFLAEPPVFEVTFASQNMATATFNWTIKEGQLREQPDIIAFRSVDNLGLAKYLLFRVKKPGIVNTIAKPEAELRLALFPNPAQDVLHVGLEKEGDVAYEIWDEAGRLVRLGVFRNEGVDIEELGAGVYYFWVEGFVTEKFLKN